MSRLVAVLLMTAGLCACATPTADQASPATRRAPTAEDVAKSEFERRAISLTVTPALREMAAAFVLTRLVDPGSAQFRFDFTSSAGSRTAVCGAVNARSGEGAYVGFQRFFVLGEGGMVRDGVVAEGQALSIQFIGLCDQSHPEHASYPLRALQSEEADYEPAGVR